jgi:GNAT superfamily N-acetyltransferase
MNMLVTNQLDQIEADVFWSMLRDYNAAQVGPSHYERLYIVLRNDDGNIIGGLNGATYWGWLFVENLVIQETHRRQGYGSQLLLAAEDEARTRGCHSAYLDTYSFQARPFYEKHRYAVFGVLDDFPTGCQRFFLKKKL